MKLVALIEFLQKKFRLVRIACIVSLLLLVVSDGILVDKSHVHTIPEGYPGFWSLFGFVSCVAIIFLSKWYGHMGIMTQEDYYDD
jgi:short subunit fatty acids transporter